MRTITRFENVVHDASSNAFMKHGQSPGRGCPGHSPVTQAVVLVAVAGAAGAAGVDGAVLRGGIFNF